MSRNNRLRLALPAMVLGAALLLGAPEPASAEQSAQCPTGWNAKWLSRLARPRWVCRYTASANCPPGWLFVRAVIAPFLFICRRGRLIRNPTCPGGTQLLAPAGKCIGTIRLRCRVGWGRQVKFVLTRRGETDEGTRSPRGVAYCYRLLSGARAISRCPQGYTRITQVIGRIDRCRRGNDRINVRYPTCGTRGNQPHYIKVNRGTDQCIDISLAERR